MLFAISLLCLLNSWATLPLFGKLEPASFHWSLYFLEFKFQWLYVISIVLALCLAAYKPILALWFAWGHFVLIIALPFDIAFNQPDSIINYANQATMRLGISAFMAENYRSNINIEPLFEPLTEVDTIGDQLSIAFAMLDTTWYIAIFVALLVIVMFGYKNPTVGTESLKIGIIVFGVLAISGYSKWRIFLNDGDQVAAVSLELQRGNPANAAHLCGQGLQENYVLSISNAFMSECFQAFYALNRQQPSIVSYINLTLQKSNPRARTPETKPKFSDASLSTYEKLLHLDSLPESGQKVSPLLNQALLKWLRNSGEQLVLQNVTAAIINKDWAYALNMLAGLHEQNLLKNLYLAYVYGQLKNYKLAGDHFSFLANIIQHPSFKANMLCGFADTLDDNREYKKAREVYKSCYEMDHYENIWAVNALSGT